MIRKWLLMITGWMLLLPAAAGSVEVYREGDVSLDLGFWGQVWYQYVGDHDRDGDGSWDDTLHDFMARRTYFGIAGTVAPRVSFFVHYAGDRIGQEELDSPGVGLGSGLALRDGWVNYNLLGNDVMIQVGRMYVPFTRNYGTTSTKALLTTDLDWGQGGLRSGIFYPGKVGRDDGVTVWGNLFDDKLQYRLMAGEGEEKKSTNPDDRLRLAGRLTFNLFDPETTWFNAGTYLGKKKILAIGGGFDYQPDLVYSGGIERNYEAYTADVHLDLPLGSYPVTAEAAYIRIHNVVNAVTWSDLTFGRDGDILTFKAGILLADVVQPFAHIEMILPDGAGADDTIVYGIGFNYYIKGPANKLTAEWTMADDEDHSVDILTAQVAFGF